MSQRSDALLKRLKACPVGQGLILSMEESRVASYFVRRGWVEWVQGGTLKVYRLTKSGRENAI